MDSQLERELFELFSLVNQPHESLMEAFQIITEWEGNLGEETMTRLGEICGLSPGHLKDVISSYPLFQTKPTLFRCTGFCCSSWKGEQGWKDLEEGLRRLRSPLEIQHHTCLGHCNRAPVLLQGQEIFSLAEESPGALLDHLTGGRFFFP